MGKSKHESFSSIDKSNFQLLKGKFRENAFEKNTGKGEENDKHDGGNKKKEEKKKKPSWWKRLSSVREQWVCQGTHSSFKKTEMAMISQFRGLSAYSERPAGDQLSVSKDIQTFERNGQKLIEKCTETDHKKLCWNTEVFENNLEIAKNNESLLTSALFIHQDMDKIVESAVFIEPHLPKDYIDSNKFDETNQNVDAHEHSLILAYSRACSRYSRQRNESFRMNKTEVNDKILEKKSDQIVKTFKSISEPTWDQRKKIIGQRRLHDNINSLLEQILLLEVEDVINLPLHQNKLMECKKKIEFSQSSRLNSKRPFAKKLSRKVSPEILVNIKPFKEYVSEDCIVNADSSTELVLNSHIFGSKGHLTIKDTAEVLEKSKIAITSGKISEEKVFPVSNCPIHLAKNRCCGHGREDINKATEIASPSRNVEKQVENYNEKQSFDFVKPIAPCAVWGLYRSYSSCTKSDDKKEEKQKEEKKQRSSIDEVLDTFDDSDHDVIFQKNISQFRKKINAIPRLDVKKPVVYLGKMEAAKVKPMKALIPYTSPKYMKPDFEEMKTVSLRLSDKKEIGEFRFDYLDLWEHGRKQEKILENIFLQSSEAKMIIRPRVEATRIEARMISFPRTLREVHDMLERNDFAVMEIEVPIRFDKDLKNMELLWVGSSENLLYSYKSSFDVKKYSTVAVVLSFQGQDFDGKFCTTENDVGKLGKHILQSSKFFPDRSECFYLVQNQLLIDCAHKSRLNISEAFSSTCLENAKKIENSKEELTSVTPREKHILKLYESLNEIHFEFVQTLNGSFYEHVAHIYDRVLLSFGTSSKSQSQPNVFESAHIAPALSNSKKDISSSEFINRSIKKTVDPANDEKPNYDFCFDGFQIIYNNSKKSLEEEEESIKSVFTKHLLEINSKSVFLSRTNTLEKVKGLLQSNEEEEEEEGQTPATKIRYSNEEMSVLRSLEKKNSKTLKYRSKSSPKETIHQAEFSCGEHLVKRSFILSVKTEQELHGYKKRRLSFEKDVGIRNTESALLEFQTPPSLIVERLCSQTSDYRILPCECKVPSETEPKNGEGKKMFVLDKNGTNMRKEVVAAFNLIKDFNKCEKETKEPRKRMSVVIMLIRK